MLSNRVEHHEPWGPHILAIVFSRRPLFLFDLGDMMCLDWCCSLVLAPSKAGQECFRAAVRRNLVAENPFTDVAAAAQVSTSREFYVTRETTDKVLAACPDSEWQLAVDRRSQPLWWTPVPGRDPAFTLGRNRLGESENQRPQPQAQTPAERRIPHDPHFCGVATLPSVQSGLNFRVELFQFCTGFFGRELPIDANLLFVSRGSHGRARPVTASCDPTRSSSACRVRTPIEP